MIEPCPITIPRFWITLAASRTHIRNRSSWLCLSNPHALSSIRQSERVCTMERVRRFRDGNWANWHNHWRGAWIERRLGKQQGGSWTMGSNLWCCWWRDGRVSMHRDWSMCHCCDASRSERYKAVITIMRLKNWIRIFENNSSYLLDAVREFRRIFASSNPRDSSFSRQRSQVSCWDLFFTNALIGTWAVEFRKTWRSIKSCQATRCRSSALQRWQRVEWPRWVRPISRLRLERET